MPSDIALIIFELCTIVISSAVLGTLFLYARQPIILAYIAAGIVIGPDGLGWVKNAENISQIGHLGVILLLFLLGLNLQPRKLLTLFKESALVTLGTSGFFFGCTFVFALTIQLALMDALVAAAALMFSSTVIGLKLIPTTTLHHQRMGEVMTSILLVQDILAITVILLLNMNSDQTLIAAFVLLITKAVALCVLAFAGVKYVILPLFRKFDVIQEYSFITTLAWCLLWAEIGHQVDLSYESGAFIAGLSIAVSKVSQAIAQHLKPLREFFLILFFFAIGAKMQLLTGHVYTLYGIGFGAILIVLKRWGFKQALGFANEKSTMRNELSARLSQASEFSLLLAYSAINNGLLSSSGMMFIQSTTLSTFVISTYWVVKHYPTPISLANKLRQD
ncbi:cation:proton antiporter domain-containing protein [Photobacterium sanguinicancri]|uniref:Cation:proton antiporter n=1 Tax=Photobacterium sanguinicancri TaxID=875932 RepID=A0AAW7Y2G4_9GAMM|nr:cation:proton antiporter [Photobacterium sanguinicancri]MDO6541619.1 cation:proton antiporter [Photobacterium sanguinicancri]